MSSDQQAPDSCRTYTVEVVRDVRIPTSHPHLTLAADLHRPVTGQPVPALVTLLPYRKDFSAGIGNEGPARWFAGHGYASLLVDIMGTGSSDGIRRPEFDPGEGEDAIAAIAWVASQPWCSGQVGMWGASYGAITTMRAASLQPPRLRAIIPLVHGMNPGHDTVHPDGARGDLHSLVQRGAHMLVQQLLPPLLNHTAGAEQQRWRRRLYETEPVFMDFARHGPLDPIWQERAIDGEAIVTPALCVGGWRDAFPDALSRAYERMQGPKKLLMGPWGHVLPHNSDFTPIDFLSIALRWWDHWLRGIDTGIMNEPPVTLYLEGCERSESPWRTYASWPPSKDELVLATGRDTTLAPPPAESAPNLEAIATYDPDPTIGASRGLPGFGMGETCLPQDQHDDDMRAVLATSEPLPHNLVIGGHPEVAVRLADSHAGTVSRLVVSLSQVDRDGRSVLITAGVLCPTATSAVHRIVLRPVAYQIPAGRRLRVTVSDADFPRLTPLPDPIPIHIVGIELSIPAIPADSGEAVKMPAVTASGTDTPVAGAAPATIWTITRDPIHCGIEVTVRSRTSGTTVYGHRYETHSAFQTAVQRRSPDASTSTGTQSTTIWMRTGETVTTSASIQTTQTGLWARGEVTIDGLTVFTRTWDAPLGSARNSDTQ